MRYAPSTPVWVLPVVGASLGVLTVGMLAESAGGGSDDPLYLGAVIVSGVVLLGSVVGLAVPTLRSTQRARGHLVHGSAEVVRQQVPGVALPGRVVRTGRIRLAPAFVAASPAPVQDLLFPRLLSVSVLDVDGAREVGVLAPGGLGPWLPGRPVVLRVHPTLRDVGVLETRITAQELARVDADPRWAVVGAPTPGAAGSGLGLRLLAAGTGGLLGLVLGVVVSVAVGAW